MRWDDLTPTLPAGWVMGAIGDIGTTQLGKMLSRKSKTGNDEQPYLRNQNVQWGHFDLADVATMEFSAHEQSKFALAPGDVVVCEGGVVGRAAVWRRDETMYFQKALHRIRVVEGVEPDYLRYTLEAMAQFNMLAEYASGSTIAHLPQEDLRILPVPIAPSAEQSRIVAEIERRLSHVDAAERSLHGVLSKLAAARLSVLRAGFDGSLIRPVGSPEELVSALVQQGRSLESSNGFVWLELQDVARWSSGGTPKAGTARYYGGDTPWAVIGDLNDGLVTATASTITDEGLKNSSAKVVPAGTLLVAMYGSIGKLGIAGIDMATNQAIATGRAKSGVNVKYVFWWLRLQRSELLAAGMGGTQSNISQTILKPWPIPVVSTADQDAIVDAIDTRMAQLDYAEGLVRSQVRRCATLRRAILAAAFRGELAAQDPADEPADVLLQRIRDERAAAGQSKAVKKKAASSSRKPRTKKESVA